jgi:leucine dehydrogenase
MSTSFTEVESPGYEQLLLCSDPSVGYRGIIALHSTKLGPAVGGTRFYRYADETAAVTDALRLARGMSYKNALAGLPFGGGKGVVWDRGAPDRAAVFRAHARAIDGLKGRFITAEDVGTTVADMEIMRSTTPYVAGLSSGAGDPAPYTARGVLRALLACAQHVWGSPDLQGRRVALQGVGGVGAQLARLLHDAGALLIIADPNTERVTEIARATGARVTVPDAIYDADADIFAPCALGGILSDETVPRLRARIVVGAANNQLLESRHAALLRERGITYGPDYVANAGGVISGAMDIAGWTPEQSNQRIEQIFDTMLGVLQQADALGISTAEAADRLAEARLRRD